MEITGRIINVLPAQSGVSNRTGNPWMSQEYVLETQDQYPRKMMFRIFAEDKIKQMNIQSGEVLTVSFDIDASEYQGRWYNRITAWAVNRTQQQVPVAPQEAIPVSQAATFPPAQESATQESTDDLPF